MRYSQIFLIHFFYWFCNFFFLYMVEISWRIILLKIARIISIHDMLHWKGEGRKNWSDKSKRLYSFKNLLAFCDVFYFSFLVQLLSLTIMLNPILIWFSSSLSIIHYLFMMFVTRFSSWILCFPYTLTDYVDGTCKPQLFNDTIVVVGLNESNQHMFITHINKNIKKNSFHFDQQIHHVSFFRLTDYFNVERQLAYCSCVESSSFTFS